MSFVSSISKFGYSFECNFEIKIKIKIFFISSRLELNQNWDKKFEYLFVQLLYIFYK